MRKYYSLVASSRGFAHIVLIIFLLISIPLGLYLVSHPQIFKPKASENGTIEVIDNLKRNFPNNIADTIYIYLKISPIDWSSISNLDQQEGFVVPKIQSVFAAADIDMTPSEYTSKLRISKAISSFGLEGTCEITGDPETNCLDVEVINPADIKPVSWLLPKQDGAHTIYVRYTSNLNRNELKSTTINFKDSSEIGYAVPTILIGGQALVTTVFSTLRGLPGTAIFNAGAELLYRVHSANEYIITLSHAQQMGLQWDLVKVSDDEVEFQYDEDQLKNGDMNIEFFPEPDPVTGEARLVINPTVNPGTQEEVIDVSLNMALGEAGGRFIGNLVNKGVTKVAKSSGFKSIKAKIVLPQNVVNVGLRQISKWQEAKGSFSRHMLRIFKPEQREQALEMFERYYTGNYNPDTGKITLYRFIDSTPEALDDLTRTGIKPWGVSTTGSMDELLNHLDKGIRPGDQEIASAYRDQIAGKDISQAIEKYEDVSVVGNQYDIATYWSPLPDLPGFSFRKYRITIEIDPGEAWRRETSERIIKTQKELARVFNRPDNVYIYSQPRNHDSFTRWRENDFEWTILGEIPSSKIKEIKDLPTGETIYNAR